MDQQIAYKAWRDKGGNIGVQCLQCGRTHWNGDLPLIDPTTQKPCEGCDSIQKGGVLEKERTSHLEEEKSSVVCQHDSTQPEQLGAES